MKKVADRYLVRVIPLFFSLPDYADFQSNCPSKKFE